VTLAAYYGAGGHVVGPRVAERLGVELLDRNIPRAVAQEMGVPEAAAQGYDDQAVGPRGLGRFLENLGRVPGPYGTPVVDPAEENRYRSETEEFLARAARAGGVVVGRAGMVVLREVPGALHVVLGGPREARIRQGMKLDGVDRRTAQLRLEAHDRAREEYVRRYGADPKDPDLFHLRIDSTAIDLDTCVDLIVAASRSRVRK
jgi:Cytidylate kinase-like family